MPCVHLPAGDDLLALPDRPAAVSTGIHPPVPPSIQPSENGDNVWQHNTKKEED